jgi:osmotically-inducible protein OsmY
MRLQKRGIHLALTGLLAVGLTACTAEPESDADLDADLQMTESDPSITASIQSKYFMDNTVKGIAIDVDTQDGVVTLAGSVESDMARDRAAQLAQATEGVREVNNQLVVRSDDLPTAEQTGIDTDEPVDAGWVTTKIEAQYFLDPDVKGRNIDVMTSTDGTVTLRGEVDTAAARTQAVSIARTTEGVADVVDELTMAAATPESADPEDARYGDADTDTDISDGWITTKIQARYFVDADVKGRNINVNTMNGVVTLTGEVESAAEQREAVALATDIDGVANVVDQLRVVPAEMDDDELVDEDGNPITDAWLTTKIQSQYFVDPDVSSLDINVTTNDRVVTLEGEVESEAEKSLAETIANGTRGVSRVVNELVVNQNGDAR